MGLMTKRILVVILAVCIIGYSTGCTSNSFLDIPAPEFKLNNLFDEEISLSQFENKNIMLNFWQLGCSPCLEELPLIQQAYSDRGSLIILTIAEGNTNGPITNLMSSNGYTFPVLVDLDGKVGLAYGIKYTPTTVFIDKNGKITNIKIGAFSDWADLLKALNKNLEIYFY